MDSIKLECKIKKTGSFLNRGISSIRKPHSFSTLSLVGDFTFIVNDVDFSQQQTYLLDCVANLFSTLTNFIVLEPSENGYISDVVDAEGEFFLKLDGETLHIQYRIGEEVYLQTKCRFLPLYISVAKIVRELIFTIYDNEPELAKEKLPDYIFFEKIRNEWRSIHLD